MSIVTTISALPAVPNPNTDDATTYAAKASAFTTALVTLASQLASWTIELNATQASINAAQSGSAIGIGYVFSSSITATDPGSGFLSLNSATQNTATAAMVSNLASDTTDWSGVLGTFTGSSSTIKGFVRISKVGDGTKWIVATISAMTSPSGYRNISLTVIGSSSANPFTNGDGVVLTFTRNGDAAAGGAAAISDIVRQTQNSGTTGGTSTAYTLTPATAATSYAAPDTYWITFNAACGNDPTLQISGLASPPNLVKQLVDGSYANIKQGDIPINHRSPVTLLSPTQAWVRELPMPCSATDLNVVDFNGNVTLGVQHRGITLNHPNADNVTARDISIPVIAGLQKGFGFYVRNGNTASSVTATPSSTTLNLAGNATATGTRTIAPGAFVFFFYEGSNTWCVSGPGVS